MIKDTPAGNMLISSALLFSGSTPGKILRLLNHVWVVCTSDSTFYNAYLYPVSVWKSQQIKLLIQYRDHGMALSIGGDNRADGSEHSAKYSSNSRIDFDIDKIMHMESIRVK